MNRVKILSDDVPDRAIDRDSHRLVEVVADPLDFSGAEGDDRHPRPRGLERLHGFRQLPFLEAVGGKDGHTEVGKLGHDDSP